MALFAFFGLWTTTVAVGAAAISVPIVIHLLNRRRFKVVVWAAMRFLLAAQKQNTRRMRLEQLILLLVRCALVALIVFAMASVMPWMETLWAAIWPDGAGPGAARGGRTHHILVLDGSLSMNVAADGKTLFDHARQMALDKVNKSPGGDGFSVLLLKESPTWIVGEASLDARKVAREIELLRASHGNASVPAALNMVAAKVTEAAQRFPVQNVYFFTDMQRATWLSALPSGAAAGAKEGEEHKDKQPYLDIGQRARTIFVDLGRDEVKNAALVGLELTAPWVTTGTPAILRVTVQNFGHEDLKNLRLELSTGRARAAAAEQPFNLRPVKSEMYDPFEDRLKPALIPVLKAGEQKTIPLIHIFDQPGTHAIQVQLKGDGDALEADDARSLVLTVKDTIPVLLINGKPAAERYERATEYLRLALQPFPKGQEPKFAPLRPKVISAAQFVDTPEGEIADYDVIFFCDVAQFAGGELRRLESHLRRGGGVVVSLGDRAAENLEVYNRLLHKNDQGLLPAKLFKKVQAPADHYFSLNAQEDAFKEPPLKAFADDNDRISLTTGRFRQFVQAKAAADAKARVVLSFMPQLDPLTKTEFDKSLATDDPAIIEWNPPLPRPPDRVAGPGKAVGPTRYRGKVVLFTSTMNMDWTSWPGSPSFGAMMQEVTRLAASGRLREHVSQVGQILEEYLPAAGAEVEALVHYPEQITGLKPQKVRTQVFDEVNILRWGETDFAGIYKAVLGNQEAVFAVNFPATTPDRRGSECDPVRVEKSKLQEHYPGWDFQVVNHPGQANYASGPGAAENVIPTERAPMGPEIAKWALWLAFLLLFVEVLLAWRFGHYSSVAGTEAQPASSVGLPLSVGIGAGVIFVLGAVVLIHASRSGDFLSFMPDAFRSWVERLLGAPPPPPGENTRWSLERISWLPAFADETWLGGFLALAAIVVIFFTYRAEAPSVGPLYKGLLGGLRLFLILLTMSVLLPQLKVSIDRQGWPDIVVLIDDSRSMGEPDVFQDEKVREHVKRLSEWIKKDLEKTLPEKIRSLEEELAAKGKLAEANADFKPEVEVLTTRLQSAQNQLKQINSASWRPSRLQLTQALLAQPELDWLHHLVHQRRSKVHIYHLDHAGRAVKLSDAAGKDAGEITEQDPLLLQRAHKAVARLDGHAMDSRLGTALRQVVDHYRGSSLTAVIMFTDGVTTRDETIGQFAEYAAQKGVPLFFVGIGDEHEERDLRLHDLQVEDTIYLGDRINFQASLTGTGYKDLTVPVVLKVKDKDGKEKELARTSVKVDPTGKLVKFRLVHQPNEVGRKVYVIEVDLPRKEGEKMPNPSNLRLERAIDVIDAKLIKVLYVEGTPRYEYRFLKSLLEREGADAKKNKSIELRVVLLDADPDFATTDKSALADFPATREELDQYDVILFGDCDPKHAKLGPQRIKMIADFVRGEDAKGKKTGKTGGGLLMIAGGLFSPHAYKGTPLADVLPIEPTVDRLPPEADLKPRPFRMDLTPIGRLHPIFRFASDETESMSIYQRLAPIYWYSAGYRLKPLAEVLAVHPTEKAAGLGPNSDGRLPLVVQQFVGSGRCLFLGIDETWRWRHRDDELKFNNFWIQTVRYLSRTRLTKTDIRLDRQTPYRVGETIKVTVRFPENIAPGLDPAKGSKSDVKVTIEFHPKPRKGEEPSAPEIQVMSLSKLEGSFGTFEAPFSKTREGKYRFRLTSPDVSKQQPDGEKPSVEAQVELPPGELDKLRMNQQELTQAAEATQGKFYTVANANELLEDLPAGFRVSIATPQPPIQLWNHWLMFLLVLGLFTAEWILRKRKHLL